MTPDENDSSELNNVPEHFPDATTRRVSDISEEREASQLLRLASKDPQHPMLAALREAHTAEVERKKLEAQLIVAENDLRETAERLMDYSRKQPQLQHETAMLSQEISALRERYWKLEKERQIEVRGYRQCIAELQPLVLEVEELRALSQLYTRYPFLLNRYWRAAIVALVVSLIFAFGFFCAAYLFSHRP